MATKKIPVELVRLNDEPNSPVLVRRFDTLGVIVPARQGGTKGWGALRLQQDLGFHSTKAKAIAAVERADKAALPDVLLTQRQLRAVKRSPTNHAA